MITEQERNYLLNSMKELLDEYDYDYTLMALNKIIDEWAEQKATLIAAFKKHPNYIDGKFMIAFNQDYERELDESAIVKFSTYIHNIAMNFDVSKLPEDINKQRQDDGCCWLPRKLFYFLVQNLSSHITARTISSETAELLETIIPQIHPHAGEKASRVINRICQYIHYDTDEEYNREFAKFADGLSPMVIKRHTVLSINPLDYFTMSFGNSWSSCHTIDKENKRGMPNSYEGMYSSGTMSYMLDGSSMVFYTVDAKYDDNDYWTQPKICRQMFHWGQEKLVQSRLYPQDNDDDNDAYTPYRNIVQDIMSCIFDFPNLWKLKKGTDAASEYIYSKGTHYRDYCNFSSCSLSRVQDSCNEECFVVGASPICIECGERHNIENNINHCRSNCKTCERCGRLIEYEDDGYWDGDYCYCTDCVCYCSVCGEYHCEDNFTYIQSEDRYVCDYCRDEYYRECDDCGGYIHKDDLCYIDCEDTYVCKKCLEEDYYPCSECGEYFPKNKIKEGKDGYYYCEDCYEEEGVEKDVY